MLENIDYKKIFTYFEEISNVPRGSRHNEKISAYLVDFAKKRGLEYRADEAYNVVIKKPACGGGTSTEPVMLQGHMDMVCVSADGRHDFLKEGLPLRIDGDYIYSEGTTLGGDDGIALAYMLAVLDSKEYTHPPLEAVFTTDEEVGMDGAAALDTSDLKAGMLINIDNEEEGVLLVSCAGGATVDIEFTGSRIERKGSWFEVSVSGLAGGHSGTEIHRHPLNASILLGRLLARAYTRYPFYLGSFEGGDKDNVITNAASAHICCAGDADGLNRCLSDLADELMAELASHEPALSIGAAGPEEIEKSCFDRAFTEAVLAFLNLTITGVQVMSGDVPGMVESSLNMGVARTDVSGIKFGFSVRSQKKGYRQYMIDKLTMLASRVAGDGVCQTVKIRGEYPAWDYRKDSRLRDLMVQEFYSCFGREPRVEGIHAGLECGILSEKMPGLDIVSVGPEIEGIHTVNERLCISSARNNFDYILRVLEKLA